MSVNVVIKSVFDDKGIKQASREFANVGKNIGKLALGIGVAFAAGSIATAKFASSAIQAAEGVQQANNRLAAINTSMGLFDTQTAAVTTRLIAFAEASELSVAVDAEVIKATQAKLLTFKDLAATADSAGGAFDRATIAALDLAAAGFGSAETNAIQLGKALQDPIKGLSALRRSGITFTEQEKAKIKTLVESNKTLEAQDLILKAIETQVGGTAEATATATSKMELAFDNLYESFGAALLPAFEDLSDELLQLTPQLSDALVPIAENLAKVFQDKVLPAIQDFTEWLGSAEGTQKVVQFTDAIIRGIDDFVKFAASIAENWDLIKNVVITLGVATIVFGGLKTALELATAAQLLFNSAAALNPYVIIAVGLVAAAAAAITLGTALTVFATDQKKAREESTGFTGDLAELAAEQDRLKELFDAGVISFDEYKKAIGPVNSQLAILQGEMMRAAGYGRQLNNVKLGSLKGELSDLAGEANRFKNLLAGIPLIKEKETKVTTGTKSDKETTQERFEKVQAVIKKAQKAILQAEQEYERTRYSIAKDSADRVTALKQDSLAKEENLIKQSVGLLTSAFKSATQLSLGELFNKQTETQLLTNVKRVSESLTLTVTKEVEKSTFSSIQSVVDGLRKRILDSRKLLENASKLTAEGFSETFIQQVIETGAETGNELASAILNASPETRAEMKSLFGELEGVSSNGMDAIARQIIDKSEVVKLGLLAIQKELDNSLIAEQQRLSTALIESGAAFALAMSEIKATFMDDLDSFDGWFAGLKGTIDSLLLKMKELSGKALTDVQKAITMPGTNTELAGASVTNGLSIKEVGNANKVVIDSMNDVAGTIAYIQARIAAANTYIKSSSSNALQEAGAKNQITSFTNELATLRSNAALGTAVGTTININVKADSTQSQAMVGKTIGNIVTKYVTTGGQVLVSGNN